MNVLSMRRFRPIVVPLLLLPALAAALAGPAEAQILARPYVAGYLGQTGANFAEGPSQKNLSWRGLSAFEVGFDLYDMTLGFGVGETGKATWHSEDGTRTFELQYREIYANVGAGARKDIGIYFAGGVNYTYWDVLPHASDPTAPFRDGEGEVGFQAYLGVQIRLPGLPVRLMVEGGYSQNNGYAIDLQGNYFPDRDLASAGLRLRTGLSLGWF